MESTAPPQQASDDYYDWIKRLCSREARDIPLWPGLANLKKFITDEHDCRKPPGISIVNLPRERCRASEFSIISAEGHWNLSEKLPSLADTSLSSQLIIVENICRDTLAILGGTYDIDPQFFAEHLHVLSWYKMDEDVPERLTSLPSTKKEEDFLALRYVETREIELLDDSSVYAGSILKPDPYGTRVEHTAGKLEPVSMPGKTFPRMAFTRQTVSVWCQKKTSGNGWIAIMLLDPPFRLPKRHGSVGRPEYRHPSLRPKMTSEFHGDENRQSFREAFCHLLQQRCLTDPTYLTTCATDPFLVLYEGYRIIASEWLVVNEYVKRELANIERHLEKPESTFRELEQYLKELYRIRRRCNKDYELVSEAATQCKNRGQALWPSSSTPPTPTTPPPPPPQQADADPDPPTSAPARTSLAAHHAALLTQDLTHVLHLLSTNIARIEKDMTLLMALVTISEGRQGLQENRGIAFLTLIATVFLPAGTVAAVLGIQTQYGPGGQGFWMLWAVVVPLTVVVVLLPVGWGVVGRVVKGAVVRGKGGGGRAVGRGEGRGDWAGLGRWRGKGLGKGEGGEGDEAGGLSSDLVLEMRQTSIYGVV